MVIKAVHGHTQRLAILESWRWFTCDKALILEIFGQKRAARIETWPRCLGDCDFLDNTVRNRNMRDSPGDKKLA